MSKYVYDTTQKGMLEKAREAGVFLFWCVMVGGGVGAVYAHNTYHSLYHTIFGFALGMSIFSCLWILVKLFEVK